MRYLSVFDSFKGTLSSFYLGKTTTDFLREKGFVADFLVMSDGGDGFLDAAIYNLNLEKIEIETVDAIGRKNTSFIAKGGDEVFIEMASSVGINHLKKEELNPFKTSSFGFGMAINEALKLNPKKIIVGLGGSASCDAGSGMLEALGVKFYAKGKLITSLNNEKLSEIDEVDYSTLKDKFKNVSLEVVCDVNNPLLGATGAIYVYAPQKGASQKDLSILEKNVFSFASILKNEDVLFEGSGAAGGTGYALKRFLNASFNSGIDYFLSLIKYEDIIKNYDVIITGEGKLDKSSLNNKAVMGIINHSKEKKIIAIVGSKTIDDFKYPCYPLTPDIASIAESLEKPKEVFLKRLQNIDFK